MRRLADIMVASAILMVTFPLLMLVALAIKYESCGPAFERTERIAADRRFTLLAFRTTGYDPEFAAPNGVAQPPVSVTFCGTPESKSFLNSSMYFAAKSASSSGMASRIFFRIEHLPQRPQRIARPATTLVYPLVRLTEA